MDMKILKYIPIALTGLLLLSLEGCTGKFEQYNTNPYAPTQEQMNGDNAATKSLIVNAMATLVQVQENNSQMVDQMVGNEYGSMTSCLNPWGNGGNTYTYDTRQGWLGQTYEIMFPQVYTPYFRIKDMTGGKGFVFQWAQVLRIYATLRVSDTYGPVPYSKITGSDYTVEYDDMPTLFDAMFADLDEAISVMTGIVNSGSDLSSLKDADVIYHGDFGKWLKFANTLKLRMAMRISGVKPDLARTKAEEAVAAGVLSEASDAAWRGYDKTNPLYMASVQWNGGEFRVSANVTSYLNGYSDPRLPIYVTKVTLGGEELYKGVRNGIYQDQASFAAYQNFSNVNLTQFQDNLAVSAAEAWLLRAEGAVKGWNMGASAKELYEQGIRVSMAERGVTAGVDAYLASTNTPEDYVDTYNSGRNISATTTVCPAWDDAASDQTKIERILIQKWIANYPNGWETWCDVRRTGYPKFFPIVDNKNTEGVTTTRGIRRMPYAQSEYNTNEANVRAAVALLGGPDTGATDLWWAKKN